MGEKENPIKIQVQALPDEPGVYHFYDQNKRILYVGKAKNLKKRVSSYFTKNHTSGKTRVMVSKIKEIRHVVVANESDALLLENSMIKQHQPRYNVLLKDDKTYPWICVKNERFPRVFSTRKKIEDGSLYFGPYTSMKTVRALLDLIRNVYTLRTCNYELSEAQIASGKVKLCLEYHIGNCAGPCRGYQLEAEYGEQIDAIVAILKGNLKPSLRMLNERMTRYAAAMEFEKAQQIKERIEALNKHQSKSQVVNPKITDLEVYSILSDPTHAYVNFMQINDGAIVYSHTLEMKKQLDETEEELLSVAIVEIRRRFNSVSKTILLPFPVSVAETIKVEVPKLGDKKSLVDLSLRNAKFFRQDRFKQMKVVDPDRHTKRILSQMKEDLHLSEDPVHIECFDNSNLQGTNPASACVVFKNAKPSKADYRKFTIKSVEGPNDFASMEEVVFRRYRRLLQEREPLPQLIVIDGGKGQLSSALKSLEVLGLRGKIAIIGIAKRLEEIYFPGDSLPLYLDKKSETLKIIQQLRNEAHRFSLKHHREKRSATAIHSELEEIPGIGPTTAAKLLKEFKSVKQIKQRSIGELEKVVSTSIASKIHTYFQS
ncbi:MAG: UvrABC system protein C [Flavobacteriaceae bacterium]|jgi:excinuclease ABC subunit C|nr:excinuclease ABC subunit UvrC [Flavobacteriaceae bacterium]CAI8193120.1 MAG: UvrABC system protein C [Flavobacteriaceae bacterium]